MLEPLRPGTYVIGVSGGVDSMALVDMLRYQSGLKLVVAHFDHGIRPDSVADRRLVQETARRLGLPFVYAEGNLGPGTGEAAARHARYAFLERVRQAAGARAVVTAHHADDVLETAILNILRGTGRRGLTSLTSGGHIVRPLLHMDKRHIVAYARKHGLEWHEDSTNTDERYARNYIRRRIMPRFTPEARLRLREIIEQTRRVNAELDAELANMLHLQPAAHEVERNYFTYMPHTLAVEFLAAWLRERGVRDFDRRTLERVAVAAKTQRPGTAIDIRAGTSIEVRRQTLALVSRER